MFSKCIRLPHHQRPRQLFEHLHERTRILRARESVRPPEAIISIHGADDEVRHALDIIRPPSRLDLPHYVLRARIRLEVHAQIGYLRVRDAQSLHPDLDQGFSERDVLPLLVHGVEDGGVAFRRGRDGASSSSRGIRDVRDELMSTQRVRPRLPIVEVRTDLSTAAPQAVGPSGAPPSPDVVGLEFLAVDFGVGIDHVRLSTCTSGGGGGDMERLCMGDTARKKTLQIIHTIGTNFYWNLTFHSTTMGGTSEEAWKAATAASSFFWPT